MKAKLIILSGFLFLLLDSPICQNWKKISKDIKTKQIGIKSKSAYILYHYNLRRKSDCFRQLSVEKRDTIFLLEREGDFQISLSLWNRSDTLTYYPIDDCNFYSRNGFKRYIQSNERIFTKYMMKLVSEWNVEEIKKEDIAHGGSIPQHWVFATRIILDGKKYKIDCFYFRDFFDIDRDGMDFRDINYE